MTKGEIPRKLLLAIANSDSHTGLSFSDNTASGLKQFADWYKTRDKYGRYRIRKAFAELKSKGFIDMSIGEEDHTKILLTELGKREVLKYRTDTIKLIPLPNWDRKWRMIISSCANQKNKMAIKTKFKKLGLHQLQSNIWVYPHPCYAEVRNITESLNISTEIKFVETNFMDNDQDIKTFFGLT